ncbi:MAG: hypothetical protein RL021_643 [Bacteroidota bacterium]|jgi:hypothetical protein
MTKQLIKSITAALLLVACIPVYAQDVEMNPMDTLTSHVAGIRQELDLVKRVKINGYVQAQFQLADSAGQSSFNGGNFAPGDKARFMIRRGRLRVQYDSQLDERGISLGQVMYQLDFTERGVRLMDAYVKLSERKLGWFALTMGIQNRMFGFEMPQSSGVRETPERGRMSQILFPNERDLGAMLTVNPHKFSRLHSLRLDLMMVNGNSSPPVTSLRNTSGSYQLLGDVSETDSKKDFIGRFSFNHSNKEETVKFGIGTSYYKGGWRIDTVNAFETARDDNGILGYKKVTLKDDQKALAIVDRGYSHREYYGGDAQLSVEWSPGVTTLRAEYIQGFQPGSSSSSNSFNSTYTGLSDVYTRPFNGAYFYFLQNILETPLQTVVKYDWFDPNTDVSGDEIGKAVGNGLSKTGAGDVKFSTLGVGLVYRWESTTRIMAYYDFVTNETSSNLSGYGKDIRDNQFTLRLQVRF